MTVEHPQTKWRIGLARGSIPFAQQDPRSDLPVGEAAGWTNCCSFRSSTSARHWTMANCGRSTGSRRMRLVDRRGGRMDQSLLTWSAPNM